jgi:hypothetical protein
MPTTVTSSSGTVYHLFQLSTANSVKTFEESIGFTVLRNDLSDGYSASALFGSDTGKRRWRITMPTLAHSTITMPTVTGIDGRSVSREQYLWDLWCEWNVTGLPFVIQSERNSQYYIAEFVDEELTYSGMKIKLYESGIELRQKRIEGETVFDVSKMGVTTYGYNWFNETSFATTWNDKNPLSGPTSDLTVTGDVVQAASIQNSLAVMRFSNSANTGRLNCTTFSQPIFETIIVMQMREAAFSNNAGVWTSAAADPILVGTSADTKFQNNLATADEYYLNGVEYGHTNLQAPMNAFGIINMKFAASIDPASIQFGKDRGTAATFAEMDMAEVVSFAQPIPSGEKRELIEHLNIKWAVGLG